VAFFPQLVAGPIERAGNLLPQFRVEHKFDFERAVEGLQMILWGAFKKMVIADRLALYVNNVYLDPDAHSAPTLFFAAIFFFFQIYCDFSAYSDIAIGTAKVFGFRLMENFRQPELSKSVREFWTRWHISLSTWFGDYVFMPLSTWMRHKIWTPLGVGRASILPLAVPSIIVFVIIGLWHGAAWTFVFFGLLQGLFIAMEMFLGRATKKWAFKVPPLARNLYTMGFICFSIIFFRSNGMDQAFEFITGMTDFSRGFSGVFAPFENGLLPARIEFALSIVLIVFLVAVDVVIARKGFYPLLKTLSSPVRVAVYYGLASAIFVSLFYTGLSQSFIYFQF
jgi:D-alanyl-lipoteichoic acid acyltransferase DltB (MBOAT superfamily)